AGHDRAPHQHPDLSSGRVVHRGGPEGDEEVQQGAQGRGLRAALERGRAQQAARYGLQDALGSRAARAIDDEGGGDVQASRQQAPPGDRLEPGAGGGTGVGSCSHGPVSYAPRAWLQASSREAALPPATASHIVRASMSTPATEARITVVFLLYRAASEVPGLVETLVRQQHPRLPEQSEWLAALF